MYGGVEVFDQLYRLVTLLSREIIMLCREVKTTSYEAPHYAAFFTLKSFHSSKFQIFSSAPCSQTPSVYVPAIMSETKFHTHTEPQLKL
jgi:hypothetical protein